MKTHLIDSVPFYPVDNLRGNRYTIHQLKPLLFDYLDIQNDMVLPAVAAQIAKLLDHKMTDVLTTKNGQRGRLHLINSAANGLFINFMEESRYT